MAQALFLLGQEDVETLGQGHRCKPSGETLEPGQNKNEDLPQPPLNVNTFVKQLAHVLHDSLLLEFFKNMSAIF